MGGYFVTNLQIYLQFFVDYWGVSIASQFNFAPQGRQEVSASYEN